MSKSAATATTSAVAAIDEEVKKEVAKMGEDVRKVATKLGTIEEEMSVRDKEFAGNNKLQSGKGGGSDTGTRTANGRGVGKNQCWSRVGRKNDDGNEGGGCGHHHSYL